MTAALNSHTHSPVGKHKKEKPSQPLVPATGQTQARDSYSQHKHTSPFAVVVVVSCSALALTPRSPLLLLHPRHQSRSRIDSRSRPTSPESLLHQGIDCDAGVKHSRAGKRHHLPLSSAGDSQSGRHRQLRCVCVCGCAYLTSFAQQKKIILKRASIPPPFSLPLTHTRQPFPLLLLSLATRAPLKHTRITLTRIYARHGCHSLPTLSLTPLLISAASLLSRLTSSLFSLPVTCHGKPRLLSRVWRER